MTRVLFVDDETRVLDGLQRMLRSRRHEWEMEFAPDGPSALQACAREPFDVVVSDMRMPGMDGAALLTEVQRRHPDTVRIVLSGHVDRAGAARAARVAHQLLTKPTDAAGLTETIERACQLRDSLGDPEIPRLLNTFSWMPTVPTVYLELRNALNCPGVQLGAITRILSQDEGIAAMVLHLVNATSFGASRHVTTLQTAVTLLGVDFIASLVLAAEIFRAYEERGDILQVEALLRHSLLVADVAASAASDGQQWEIAYIAGLLHDLGRLAMLEGMPRRYGEVVQQAREAGTPLEEAESAVLGVTHAQVGAYLLRYWNLPEGVVEAVAFHHAPSAIGAAAPMVPLAVHVADHLAHEVAGDIADPVAAPALDTEAVRSAGVEGRIDEWRRIAQRVGPGN